MSSIPPAACGLLAALAWAPMAFSAAQPAAPDAVDQLFQPWASGETPGCAVAASHQGLTVLSRAYGAANLDDGVHNTPVTVFEAGSASKQFTAAAILLLVEEGRLALTDDIRKHLPEMPAYGEVITVDHLLHHTSGLRDWRYVAGVAGDLPGEVAHSNADALAIAVRQRGLNHPTGTQYAYTNTGYTLLAVIVERVSGQSLAAFSNERLFMPLGMKSTQWRDDFRRVIKHRARAYARVGERYAEDMPFESAYGAGGLMTTVGDLLIWNNALDTARLGARVTARLQEPGRLNDGQPISYARGLFIERQNGALEAAHRGVTGGYRAWLGRYPEHKVSVAILCNGVGEPEAMGRQIAARFLPTKTGAAPAAASADAAPAVVASPQPRWRPARADLDVFVGRYVSDEAGATYLARLEQGRLVLRLDGRAAAPLVLSPTYQDTFVFAGGRVRFSRTRDGVGSLTIDVQRAAGLRFVRVPRASA